MAECAGSELLDKYFDTNHKMPLGFIKNHPACEVRA